MPISPVFIVGSPRSGTSILTIALLRSGYNGFYEGNFLSLIRSIEKQVDRHFQIFYSPNEKVLTSKVDQNALKANLTRVLIETVSNLNSVAPWLDKTGGPEMIEAIPILRRHFPESRFILAKRRGIENVVSRLRKFPQFNFEYHCADWARTMAAWRSLELPERAEFLTEVDQRNISASPSLVGEQLRDFLQLSDVSVSSLIKEFTVRRPQETEAGSAGRVLSLKAIDWTDAQIDVFRRICGAEMAAEGYSEDQTYWVQ